MSYDLRPRNKAVGKFRAKGWVWMLNSGVGLPLGFGQGFHPAQFIYKSRPDGLCLGNNEGARVTASEAKMMAKIARWVADYQDSLYEVWMKESEDSRRRMETDKYGIHYKLPVRRDIIENVRLFADWAEKSSGFTVH